MQAWICRLASFQLAKQSRLAKDSQESEEKLFALAKHYGLFFFYRSTCPYCHRFFPILKAFAKHYGFALVPIPLDGNLLPEFPNSQPDAGQSIQFNVSVVPAVFAINPRLHQAIPLAYGLVSWDELKERLVSIQF